MLMVFVVFSTYAWIRFYKQRHAPFQREWWKWLIITGVALGLTLGVKMVGLFVVASVGICVLFELWELLNIDNGLTMVSAVFLILA
jgi:dolichyl-phosphate-mannose-protein mannosyltransferase